MEQHDPGTRFRLENGQLAWLTFGDRFEDGYARAAVSVETPKTEQAAIAALIALSVGEIDPQHVRPLLSMLRPNLATFHAWGRHRHREIPLCPRYHTRCKKPDWRAPW